LIPVGGTNFEKEICTVPVPYNVDSVDSMYFSELNNTLANDAGSAILDNGITW